MMGKSLTPELILARGKSDNLNMIKKINLWGNDIEDVKLLRQMPNIEILSLSVNKICSLKEFSNCPKLQELYLRKNAITDISELRYLTGLQNLRILWLLDNPCSEIPNYREYTIKMLPNLVKLDNDPITPEERSSAAKLNINFNDYNKDDDTTNDYEDDQSANYQSANQPENVLKHQYSKDRNEEEKILKKEISYEKQQTPTRIQESKYQSVSKNENILIAIQHLLKELDGNGLETIKKEVDKRLRLR